jgi:hypothetical protein
MVAILVLALGWGAMSLLPNDQPDTVDGEEPSAATASPTPPTPSALTNPEARSADDFRAIYEELEGMVAQAFAEHRPELLDEAFGPDCPVTCRVAERKDAIRNIASAGGQLHGFGPRVLLIDVLNDSAGVVLEGQPTRTVTVRLVDEQAPYTVLRPDGSTLESSPGWAPRASVYSFYFSPETGNWRVFDLEIEGPAEDVLGPNWRSSVKDR